jgi:hypothetical protein
MQTKKSIKPKSARVGATIERSAVKDELTRLRKGYFDWKPEDEGVWFTDGWKSAIDAIRAYLDGRVHRFLRRKGGL